jgi:uncharacterized OB-fold protein
MSGISPARLADQRDQARELVARLRAELAAAERVYADLAQRAYDATREFNCPRCGCVVYMDQSYCKGCGRERSDPKSPGTEGGDR